MQFLNFRLRISLGILWIILPIIRAYRDPCSSQDTIGSSCDYDSDCIGFGVICKLGICDCHMYYKAKNDTDGSRYCVKLPDTINAPCTDGCRFPMFCNNGRCQCIRSKVQGNQCLAESVLGDTCSKHYECTQPFSACINNKCACIAGTTQVGSICLAVQHCPDGGPTKGNCVRLSDDISSIQNQFNASSISTCPNGYFCYTSDVSISGHCCPQLCPYSIQPDASLSCSPGASNQCPLESHYCHRLAGQSFSSAVCCRRPCKEPNPVYINGKCYPRAWLGARCTIHEQCEGGDGMQCVNGQCICKAGYKPQTGTYITSENPPQYCIKDCGSGLNARGGDCFANAGLGQQCDVDEQCPSNARCYRGTCFCSCELGYSKSGGSCIKLPPTTQQPIGVTNSGQNGFLNIFNGIFGKGGILGG